MALEGSFILLGLIIVSVIGIFLKTIASYKPKSFVKDSPIWATVAQLIFLIFLTMFWVLIFFVK